jgi:two-component system, NtrC family, C4-dicarboxylate transport response regulator DctD
MPNEPPIVVVADDEEPVRATIERWARRAGICAHLCSTVDEAKGAIDQHLKAKELAGVISDLKITGGQDDGWGVLGHAYHQSKALRLALFTGFGKEPIHELFRSGAAVPAFTVFIKDEDDEKLQAWLRSVRDSWDDRLAALTLKDSDTKRIYETIAPVYARSRLPMLLLGETGTGKESLARHIHEASRRKGPMLSINCGGL